MDFPIVCDGNKILVGPTLETFVRTLYMFVALHLSENKAEGFKNNSIIFKNNYWKVYLVNRKQGYFLDELSSSLFVLKE